MYHDRAVVIFLLFSLLWLFLFPWTLQQHGGKHFHNKSAIINSHSFTLSTLSPSPRREVITSSSDNRKYCFVLSNHRNIQRSKSNAMSTHWRKRQNITITISSFVYPSLSTLGLPFSTFSTVAFWKNCLFGDVIWHGITNENHVFNKCSTLYKMGQPRRSYVATLAVIKTIEVWAF
jgi:hypothetical protein